jgi:hypothetical protein
MQNGPDRDIAASSLAKPSGRLFGEIVQVCLVVRNFESAIKHLARGLGIGPFKCWEFTAPKLVGTTFQGQKIPWSMKLGGAWLGEVHFEVIEPLAGPSIYHQFLDQRGPGIQHILVQPQGLTYQAALDQFTGAGFPVLQSGVINIPLQLGPIRLPALPSWLASRLGLRFSYLDTEAAARTVLELVGMPPLLSFRMGNRLGIADFWTPPGGEMPRAAPPEPLLDGISCLGWVVRDLDRSIAGFHRLGVGPWHVDELDQGPDSQAKLYGQTAQFKVRLGQAQIGGMTLRLTEPLHGGSLYHERMSRNGEGLFFLGQYVSKEVLQARVAQLQVHGFQIEMAYSDTLGGRAVYLNLGNDLAASVAFYTHN